MSNQKQTNEKIESKKKNYSKIKYIIGASILAGVSAFGGFTIGKQIGLESPATTKYYSTHKKIATVNGEEISANDFKASMNILFHMNKDSKMTDEEISSYESQLIQYSTMNKAIYNVAVKAGVKADEESVKLNYSEMMRQLEESLGMSKDEIFKKFNLTESGVMESLRVEYIVNAYLEKESTFTEADALKYYNENPDEFYQYKASHILISTSDSAGNSMSEEEKAKAKTKAEELLKQIKEGANFEELAKANSQDGSAQSGGDLGYFGKDEMVKEFETAVAKTEIGQLYPELVETQYGYHIIKRTGESTKSFEDSKEGIINDLSYNKKTEIIQKIEDEADIKVFYKG